MNDDRRYSREEIETLFERATDESHDGAHAADLTLAELKEIAREVGIPPERVEAVALEMRRQDQAKPSAPGASAPAPRADERDILDRVLAAGPFPLRVAHVAPLPRSPNDAEWERLVADLRGTFGARGRVREYAGVRHWSNGNLHVLLEPTDTGPRLRMRTSKGSAQSLGGTGAVLIGTGVLSLLAGIGPAVALLAPGVGLLAAGILPLRGWAARRSEQMRTIAAHWTRALEAPPADTAGRANPDVPIEAD